MSLRNYAHAVTTLLLVSTLAGCAQMSGKMPVVSLKKAPSMETEFNIARLYERQKRLGAARKLYGKMSADNPQNLEVLHRLAVVSTRLGDFEQANGYYQKSLEADPHNADVLADFGYSLHLQGDLEGAEAALRKSLDLSPDNQRTIGNLALVVGLNGRSNESLSLYRQVVGEAKAQANLGYIHVQRGEGDQAIERYDRALTLDTELTSAANALMKLAELKNATPLRKNGGTSTLLQVAEKPVQNNVQPEATFGSVVRGQTNSSAFPRDTRKPFHSEIQSPQRIDQNDATATDPVSVDPASFEPAPFEFELSTEQDVEAPLTETAVGPAGVQRVAAPMNGMGLTAFALPQVLELVPANSGR
jgi:Flp pilus assembly protein TadD